MHTNSFVIFDNCIWNVEFKSSPIVTVFVLQKRRITNKPLFSRGHEHILNEKGKHHILLRRLKAEMESKCRKVLLL